MPRISVIVPVYNVEKYLCRCVDSILAQTFTDFELILVDDGSLDNSGKICDEYIEKDSRIRVIHKENGGVSSARNKGLNVVSSKYITFCDSDDYVDSIWLQVMYDRICSCNVDCVATNYREVNENNIVLKETFFKKSITVFTDNKCRIDYLLTLVLAHKTGWSIWSRLFKTKLIKDNSIAFCENCDNYAEDLGFFLEYLSVCESVCNLEDCVYNYFQRSKSKMNTVKQELNLDAINQMVRYIEPRFNKDETFSRYFPLIFYKIFWASEYTKLYSEKSFTFKELPLAVKKIKEYKYYKKMNKKCIFSKKLFLEYYSKNETSKIRYFLWYLNHGNYKSFVLCDVIYHRLFYKSDRKID